MPGSQLLNMVKTDLRAKHYSERTEKTYINWIRSYIIFHNKQHTKDLWTEEIKKFINNLADEGKVSAATQNQALNSILYFYKNILRKDIKWIENIKYALRKKHLPTEWLWCKDSARITGTQVGKNYNDLYSRIKPWYYCKKSAWLKHVIYAFSA